MPFERGRAKTGGRKPGVANKRTIERQQLLQDAIAASRLLPEDVADMSPLAVLLHAMRTHMAANNLEQAVICAEKAAPFCHPKLSQADFNVTNSVEHLSREEIEAELAAIEARRAVTEQCKATGARLSAALPARVVANGNLPVRRRRGLLDDLDDEALH